MDVAQPYSIAYKGLKPGPHDFDFRVGGGLFEAFPVTEIRGGDCNVRVQVERSETQLALDVTIEGYVVVACDRCLDDVRVPVSYQGRLLVKFSDEIREYDGEVMWLSPVENEVDLTQYIYESIVLALPYQRVHPEGECDPAMLEKFRIVSGEEFARIEAAAKAEAAGTLDEEELAKLEALKAKLEDDRTPGRTGKGASGRESKGGGRKTPQRTKPTASASGRGSEDEAHADGKVGTRVAKKAKE